MKHERDFLRYKEFPISEIKIHPEMKIWIKLIQWEIFYMFYT